MRQKMKRRWFACLWSSFLLFCLWTFISFIRSKSVNSAHLAHFKSVEDAKLKLIIVEEHHEVLGAWTEAYLSGVLPPNSTLVHIDAHPDDGLPQWTAKLPLFRLPRNEEEVDHMMQANDRFIVGAKIAHLVDRSIWIYPFWRDEQLYGEVTQELGTTVFRGAQTLCDCRNDNGTFVCQVLDEESTGPEPVTIIPRRLCKVQKRTRVEIIRDVFARTRLPVDKKWLGHDSLIVDIDEDFFGVHLVGNTLLDARISWRDVLAVSTAVSSIMCPLIPNHEAIADRWFYSVLEGMEICAVDSKRKVDKPQWCNNSKSAENHFFRPFRSDKAHSKLFCQWEKSADVDFNAKRAFNTFWNILRRLRVHQLLALRRTGVCLEMSMRTLGLDPKLHLCLGGNTPNKSSVVEHWPSPPELSQQYERFRLILQHLPTRPRIITLCRSSRDGYVPRLLQGEIERNLVNIMRDVFKLTDNDIVYDNLLLNGKKGDWYHRKYR